MPNHCTNYVRIEGEPAKIKELVKRTKLDKKIKTKFEGDVDQFDFNGIIKMPKSLEVTSGSNTNLGLACFDQKQFDQYSRYSWFAEKYPNIDTPAKLKRALEKSDDKNDKQALENGRIAYENIKKYGAPTWYEWCNANWGTKWNAYSVQVREVTDTAIKLQFDTAWCPPEPIFDELTRQGYSVNGYWQEEGGGEDYIGDGNGVYVNHEVEVEL